MKRDYDIHWTLKQWYIPDIGEIKEMLETVIES